VGKRGRRTVCPDEGDYEGSQKGSKGVGGYIVLSHEFGRYIQFQVIGYGIFCNGGKGGGGVLFCICM
jgi:hypothetical protein